MLKSLAILAVILAVAQTSVPAFGQAPDNHTKTSSKVDSDGHDENKPAATPPVVQANNTPTGQTTTNQIQNNNNPHTVKIAEPVTVSVTSGWRDNLALIFNGLLLLVGLGGVVAAFVTLNKLERQTKATEKALVLAQRPRIIVRNFYFTDIQSGPRTISGIQEGSVAQGQFYIANTGGTDAILAEIVCEAFIAGQALPVKRFYEGKIGQKLSQIMPPGTSITHLFALPKDNRITAHEHKSLLGSATRFLHVAGWIGYRDGLKIYRRTHFCYRYSSTFPEQFRPVNNPDYEYSD